MGFEDFISESEAAGMASVAPSTLARFAEAGYLQIEHDVDGVKLFSRSEVAKLFSVNGGSFSPSGWENPAFRSSRNSSPQSKSEQTIDVELKAAPLETASKALPSEDEGHIAPLTDPSAVPSSESTSERPRHAEELFDSNVMANPLPRASEPAQPSNELLNLERDLNRFKLLVDMQERLLDMRENEIKDLKKERDWLRERVERNEEKHDRDQLLLLSETQTIRKLVASQEGSKSSLQFALEWFGFKKSTPRAALPGTITQGYGSSGLTDGAVESSRRGESGEHRR